MRRRARAVGLRATSAVPCQQDAFRWDGPGRRCTFVENRGQWPAEVAFACELSGLRVRAECGEIVLQMQRDLQSGVLVRLRFEGPSAEAVPQGLDRLEGRHSYFIGNDRSRWHRGVPSYARVRYHGLYPGIDLVLGGDGNSVEYDLMVAPGSDLSQVRLRREGLSDLTFPQDDQLAGEAPELGVLLHLPGRSFEFLPTGERRELVCHWIYSEDGLLVPEVPAWDHSLPLVIDPELAWSTYLGGVGSDAVVMLANDPRGDVYAAGGTNSPDFPLSPGAYDGSHGSACMTLTKLRAADGALLYASHFGPTFPQYYEIRGLVVDSTGRATVVGITEGADFPTTPGSYDPVKDSSGSYASGFVLCMSPAGDALEYSTFLEGAYHGGEIVALDTQARAVVGGYAEARDFPTTPGAFQTHSSGTDGFVARLSYDGSALEWSTLLGGAHGGEAVQAVAVDADGYVTVAGRTNSLDFPVTHHAFQTRKVNLLSFVGFVSRLTPEGDALVWSSYLGGVKGFENDQVHAIALTSTGSVVLCGSTNSSSFPVTPGAYQTWYPSGSFSGFVTRFAPDGESLLYSTFLSFHTNGGTGRFATDRSGVVTVIGHATPTPGAYDVEGGPGDSAVARLSPQGDRVFYSTYLGGPSNESGGAITMTPAGRVVVGGYVYSPGGYPTTANAFQPNFGGGQFDGVITSFDLYLQGITRLEPSVPSCEGPLVVNATLMPSAGSASFGLYCSAAPANTAGRLTLSGQASVLEKIGASSSGSHALGLVLPVQSDAEGYVETSVSLALASAGESFTCRYEFPNVTTCSGAAATCTSDTLRVTVQ